MLTNLLAIGKNKLKIRDIVFPFPQLSSFYRERRQNNKMIRL